MTVAHRVPTLNCLQKIPGLSKTSEFNFQDFPVPNSFSWTFQFLKVLETKIQDFPGFSRRRWNPGHS